MKANPLNILNLFLLIASFAISVNANGQKKDSFYFKFSDLSEIPIQLPAPGKAVNTSLNNIIVKDARFDTSMIGLVKSSYLSLGEYTTEEISKYLHSSFKLQQTTDPGNSVFIYIKKFWLSNELKLSANTEVGRTHDKGRWQKGLACKMECYYEFQDHYYPLFRIDTMLTTYDKLTEVAPVLITNCLDQLTRKIIYAVAGFNINKKKLLLSEVEKHYSKRFDIPVLKETTLRKGLYKNFDEFLNNKPFQSEFEVRKSKFTDIIYMHDSTGNEFPARDIWGYCDGINLFVKYADNYFPLTRVGNSFCLKGFKDLERWLRSPTGAPTVIGGYSTTSGIPQNDMPMGNQRVSYKVFYKLYEVDMETGDIF